MWEDDVFQNDIMQQNRNSVIKLQSYVIEARVLLNCDMDHAADT